jgi:hypothetical protein
MHRRQGIGVSYMDGHAEFQDVNSRELAAGIYDNNMWFVHRTFWGRKGDGTYISGYYRVQP